MMIFICRGRGIGGESEINIRDIVLGELEMVLVLHEEFVHPISSQN